MTSVAPGIRDLAEQILVQENCLDSTAPTRGLAALRVFDRLRPHLARFFGVGGYTALLNRAIALAAQEAPWIGNLRVQADGTLEMPENLAPGDPTEGTLVFLAQLLGLLETFVGSALTLRLVQDIWPNVSIEPSLHSQYTSFEVAL
jgi:hypothetical protein